MSFSTHASSDGEPISKGVPSQGSGSGHGGHNGEAGPDTSLSSSVDDSNVLSDGTPEHLHQVNSIANDANPARSLHQQSRKYEGKAKKLAVGLQRKGVTTLMIRNMPTMITQKMFFEELVWQGFDESIDFFYLPCCFLSNVGKGYAFINFTSSAVAADFVSVWHTSRFEGSESVLNISAAAVQGLEANVKKWDRYKRIRNPDLRPYVKAAPREGGDEDRVDDAAELLQEVTEQHVEDSHIPMHLDLDDLNICCAGKNSLLAFTAPKCPPGLAALPPGLEKASDSMVSRVASQCSTEPSVWMHDMESPAYVHLSAHW
eukprot:TRINITY_DN6976_c0_g4_i1.p1 TRINITY_DN6976_c0_g4~~TRINITY_DN6976_c0_g4_i1.p1  ORF type:complete len:316 (-),score=47.52 TRINITY_DN6976_c0_g4_i1:242-1189(-)